MISVAVLLCCPYRHATRQTSSSHILLLTRNIICQTRHRVGGLWRPGLVMDHGGVCHPHAQEGCHTRPSLLGSARMRILSGNMNSILHQSRCKPKVIGSQTAAALSLFRAVVVHVVDFRSDARTWCVSNMAIVVDSLPRPKQRRARPGPSQIRASAEHHRRLRYQSTDSFVRRPAPTAVGPKEKSRAQRGLGQ
ncbi:hypothetical protein CCHR01_10974 [Colletotrichum chrysophilum]|uniref:Uncharacterized protein n=1 Tax=Colletotrichum chrysophilum TaxID=1836956 RepID=A0AAD9ADX2_9PEZI|nr:hypothetical protein CCHR01_10974 [Colletotrichum chrysophilum]